MRNYTQSRNIQTLASAENQTRDHWLYKRMLYLLGQGGRHKINDFNVTFSSGKANTRHRSYNFIVHYRQFYYAQRAIITRQ